VKNGLDLFSKNMSSRWDEEKVPRIKVLIFDKWMIVLLYYENCTKYQEEG